MVLKRISDPSATLELVQDTAGIERPQWSHPLLRKNGAQGRIELEKLRAFAYDFYLRFLPFFKNQPEGSISVGVTLEFTKKMRQKLGLALLFEHKIRLNEHYFAQDPRLLPYTLFHEMTHIWLYDCNLDPGHTRRFYNKMAEFNRTGLMVDETVHIHDRVAPEAKFVYQCPNCYNRWFMRDKLRRKIFCGHCFDREKIEYYPYQVKSIVKSA